MSSYDITEVPAYRLADGRIVQAAEVTQITAYQTSDGTLYVTKDEAQQSLVNAAFGIIDVATADVARAAVQNANSEDAQKVRYAILYLAEIMKAAGAA